MFFILINYRIFVFLNIKIMKKFRKGEKEDLKIGTIYMIRYNSYKTDDECVEKEILDYDIKYIVFIELNIFKMVE